MSDLGAHLLDNSGAFVAAYKRKRYGDGTLEDLSVKCDVGNFYSTYWLTLMEAKSV
jgi:hypothetical protein